MVTGKNSAENQLKMLSGEGSIAADRSTTELASIQWTSTDNSTHQIPVSKGGSSLDHGTLDGVCVCIECSDSTILK
jgi:hypothetical protein